MFLKDGKILYVGKAANLADRTRSYFSSNLEFERGAHISKMVREADKLNWRETGSALEAVILEANLIKKYQPPYNTKDKDNKSFNFVVITKEKFPKVKIVRGRELGKIDDAGILYVFGPFPFSSELKKVLKIIRKIFPYSDKCSEKDNRPCFYRQLGLCPGVCTGEISEKEYGRYIKQVVNLFSGKKEKIIKDLQKQMKKYADNLEFEQAAQTRDQIEALESIKETSLVEELYKTSLSGANVQVKRIESFDVAHLQNKARVGVMVVFKNGKPSKKDYRQFLIKTQKGGDTDALREVLERRFKHTQWQYPDLIVVDGGKAQCKVAEKVLHANDLDIPIVAVKKDKTHNPKEIIGSTKYSSLLKDTILQANLEAHRFAISLHRRKMRKDLLE